MTLNDYQKDALGTCLPSCDNFSYMCLNLVGELGEFASKVAKAIRRSESEIRVNRLDSGVNPTSQSHRNAFREELKLELGDILWQLSGLCHTLNLDLEDVAQANLDKLSSRKDRGVIDGNGDHR